MKTKSDAVDVIGQLLTELGDRMDDGTDHERDYLVAQCPARLEPLIREMPTRAVHLLSAIGDGATNIVGLASQSGELKGTVSKLVQRLVQAGLVERGPVPGNRKEIRLSLTPDGRRLYDVHRRLHDEMQAGLREFFLRYTAAELGTVTKVLTDLLATERRGVGMFTRISR
ncbi:MAG TPA: MarR family transcriptional regulator [Mycobacterium sp.]|nr:MarR family transcriptional regulator [Mycobacterium sp.]